VLLVDLAALFGGVPGVERMAGLALDMVRRAAMGGATGRLSSTG
jgi:hypothetical protein